MLLLCHFVLMEGKLKTVEDTGERGEGLDGISKGLKESGQEGI